MLSRTRWFLSTKALNEAVDPLKYIASWRERFHVPRYLYVVAADRRFFIDCCHPLVAELINVATKNMELSTLMFVEASPDVESTWLQSGEGISPGGVRGKSLVAEARQDYKFRGRFRAHRHE